MTKNLFVNIYPKEVISKMKQHYQKYCAKTPPSGAVFQAKVRTVTITAYSKSGKVLFQGPDCVEEAALWHGGTTPIAKVSTSATVMKHNFVPPSGIDSLQTIGSDEAGTGDFFGPVTVAAAFVKPEQVAQLKAFGVCDSKQLTDKQILLIADTLKQFIPFSLLTLDNQKYNIVQAKGMTQGKMKAMLHEKAIQNLIKKIAPEKPEALLIDQFCLPDVYFRHTKTTGKRETPIYFSTKAESISIAVAAASIIARAAFVKHMDLMGEILGETIPKGASSKVDAFAAEIIRTQGLEGLKQYTKSHFANTQKAVKLASKR